MAPEANGRVPLGDHALGLPRPIDVGAMVDPLDPNVAFVVVDAVDDPIGPPSCDVEPDKLVDHRLPDSPGVLQERSGHELHDRRRSRLRKALECTIDGGRGTQLEADHRAITSSDTWLAVRRR